MMQMMQIISVMQMTWMIEFYVVDLDDVCDVREVDVDNVGAEKEVDMLCRWKNQVSFAAVLWENPFAEPVGNKCKYICTYLKDPCWNR